MPNWQIVDARLAWFSASLSDANMQAVQALL